MLTRQKGDKVQDVDMLMLTRQKGDKVQDVDMLTRGMKRKQDVNMLTRQKGDKVQARCRYVNKGKGR